MGNGWEEGRGRVLVSKLVAGCVAREKRSESGIGKKGGGEAKGAHLQTHPLR